MKTGTASNRPTTAARKHDAGAATRAARRQRKAEKTESAIAAAVLMAVKAMSLFACPLWRICHNAATISVGGNRTRGWCRCDTGFRERTKPRRPRRCACQADLGETQFILVLRLAAAATTPGTGRLQRLLAALRQKSLVDHCIPVDRLFDFTGEPQALRHFREAGLSNSPRVDSPSYPEYLGKSGRDPASGSCCHTLA